MDYIWKKYFLLEYKISTDFVHVTPDEPHGIFSDNIWIELSRVAANKYLQYPWNE